MEFALRFERRILLIIGLTFLGLSCRKEPVIQQYVEPVLPEEIYDYESIVFPDYFIEDPLVDLFISFGDVNPVTNEGATLGRVLFYDENLSVNRSISCASCHLQEFGFSDPDQYSKGFEDQLGDRNAMSTVNLSLQRRFFWDNRANGLEQQVLMPIEHPVEMGMDLINLTPRLKSLPYYRDLFEAAFGDPEINLDRTAKAIAQFVKSIKSFDSKYDQGLANDFANFTEEELFGKDLFFSGEHSCVNCHLTPNFGGFSINVNGLDLVSEDPGLGKVTGDPEDLGAFKTVSLRNIGLTAPYMHDGRFATLEAVIDFYSTDIQQHPGLHDLLTTNFTKGGPPKVFNFTQEQKDGYVAFLNTLTDWSLTTNPIYSDPFPE